ncbi:CoA-transferase family III domain-containing protein [Mycena vulgaris]|nr:CoA-transferase family III domain-containing protein [Mycena vulgaris]
MNYSVPVEARKIFLDGILSNPAHRNLPSAVNDLANNVVFEGNAAPLMPMNWRFAEAASAMKALEVTLVNALVEKKYGVKTGAVRIDTDRANLLYMAYMLTRVDPDGVNAQVPPALNKFIKDKDYHKAMGSEHRRNATNFYRAKDGRYIYIYGGMNPDITLTALGLPLESKITGAESIKLFQDVVGQLDSHALEKRLLEEFKQAVSVTYTAEQYRLSEQGAANAHVGLFEVHHIPDPSQKPCWWPESPSFPSTPQRPLAGLKVVDLTRVIASPAITRGLAEYGASVLRVTAGHICDLSALHPELNWGKWNTELDLRNEADREKLKALILDADVVVNGYRPGVLDKYGFGKDGVLKLVKGSGRDRGIVYARVNCFGWNGPWANRPGWQQISDASTGIAIGFAKAMGLQDGDAVAPLFPTADYCCGLAGSSGVLQALIERNEKGGSYVVDVALNYFNSWLAESCGEYPADVWTSLRELHGNPVFLPHQNLPGLSIHGIQLLMKNAPGRIIRSDWLEDRQSDPIGACVRTVKPIAEWVENPDGSRGVQPGFNVGTRGNGVDVARWPENLLQEVVL